MDRAVELLLLGMRWLLLPLYVALLLALLAIYVTVGRELWHIVAVLGSITDAELVILLCSVLDLVLIANLLVMVAVSSYESYISRIVTDETLQAGMARQAGQRQRQGKGGGVGDDGLGHPSAARLHAGRSGRPADDAGRRAYRLRAFHAGPRSGRPHIEARA